MPHPIILNIPNLFSANLWILSSPKCYCLEKRDGKSYRICRTENIAGGGENPSVQPFFFFSAFECTCILIIANKTGIVCELNNLLPHNPVF